MVKDRSYRLREAMVVAIAGLTAGIIFQTPTLASKAFQLDCQPSLPPDALPHSWCLAKECLMAPANLKRIQEKRPAEDLDNARRTIVLGRFEQEPYIVAIPGRDRDRLHRVRQCVPDAMILPSRRGQYIHVASFENRAPAETLSRFLRRIGFDARVSHFK